MLTRQEQIDEIFDNFDWQRVHKCMAALDWKWQGEGVPEVSAMKKCVRRLFKDFEDSVSNIYTSSGGFKVSGNVQNGLCLEFIVESWEADDL